MKLYSVCPICDDPDFSTPFDGARLFGEVDQCPKCGAAMDIWTESGVRNENARRWFAGLHAAVGTGKQP